MINWTRKEVKKKWEISKKRQNCLFITTIPGCKKVVKLGGMDNRHGNWMGKKKKLDA